MNEIEPGWYVSIMDTFDDNYQYPAIFHKDHCIDLERKSAWRNAGGDWFDDDGEPKYCRRCVVLIPESVLKTYKGLVALMSDGEKPYRLVARHFFRRPTTKG